MMAHNIQHIRWLWLSDRIKLTTRRIKNGQVPDFLKNKVILEIDPSELVAGCEYRGQFEETMKNIKMIWQKYNLVKNVIKFF